jgi:HlyD family secretion protein
MGDVTIRAPIEGTIIEKTVEVGQIVASASQNVSGGTTLLKMADLSTMQVRALVDETDIGRVEPGMAATVMVEAYPQQTFRGEVLKVEPQAVVEQNVTMFPVLVRLDNEEGLLKPGMNAEVAIDVAMREDVVVIPNAAVVAPLEAAAAAEALGLDPEALGMGFGTGGGGGFGGGGPRGGEAGGNAGAVRPVAAGRRNADRPGGASEAGGRDASLSPECAALIQRVRSAGERPSEEDRARLQECRREAGGAGTGGGAPGEVETRPAIVFVAAAGGPELRRVRLGVNDWDRSEVVSGLEAGERVYLVSVARLKQQQEEFQQRIRERTGSPVTGAGGGSAGRRGGT